jgi:hypothetical protein
MSSPTEGNTTVTGPPTTVTPSPLDMPGAKAIMNPPVENMKPPISMPVAPKSETKPPEGDPTPPIDVDELQAKYKGVQEIARKFEKAAKENTDDAERYRQLVQTISGQGNTPPDPIAEIQRLRQDIETERTERVRADIARITGVPPGQIHGTDEASMRSSAEQALSWAQSLAQQAGRPVVAPAETVNSNTPTHQTGVTQIRSKDELNGMSSKDIMQAYKEGRLDYLQGKTSQ